MDIFAGDGFGNVALNFNGNRNRITAEGGFLNIATNVGGFGAPGNPNTEIPNGSDNDITTTGGFSWASNSQTALGETCPQGPCGNTVSATGPFAFVIAAGVVRRIVENETPGPSFVWANSNNSEDFPPRTTWPINTLAAQRNVVRPSLNATPGLNSTSNLSSTSSSGPVVKPINPLAASAKKFNDRLAASAKKFNDRLAASAKKFNDSVNATRAGAKPDTASTSDSDSDSDSDK